MLENTYGMVSNSSFLNFLKLLFYKLKLLFYKLKLLFYKLKLLFYKLKLLFYFKVVNRLKWYNFKTTFV
jgi:hypothetical protein